MMRIIGIGSDIVHIPRVAELLTQFETRFTERIFSLHERKTAETLLPERRAAFYAKRFAAREALAKALGSGFRDGMRMCDIQVHTDALGKPSLAFEGHTLKVLEGLLHPGETWEAHLSLSDDPPVAQAFVILVAQG